MSYITITFSAKILCLHYPLLRNKLHPNQCLAEGFSKRSATHTSMAGSILLGLLSGPNGSRSVLFDTVVVNKRHVAMFSSSFYGPCDTQDSSCLLFGKLTVLGGKGQRSRYFFFSSSIQKVIHPLGMGGIS